MEVIAWAGSVGDASRVGARGRGGEDGDTQAVAAAATMPRRDRAGKGRDRGVGCVIGVSNSLQAPNGLEMSRPPSPSLVSRQTKHPAGRVGSIELLGAHEVGQSPSRPRSGLNIVMADEFCDESIHLAKY